MDSHPDPGPVSVNNLPAPVRKLYNQTRRINSRIVCSKHRLQIFHSHIHSGTLPKGYSPKINPAIGSNSQEFQNDWANNLGKYGNEQLKLSINKTNKLIDSLTTQSNFLLHKLKESSSQKDFHSLANKLNNLNTKLEKQLNSSKIDKSNKNKPPSTNNPPIELHNLADKQKRIQGRKRKKNRRYLKHHDYLTKCKNKYDKCDDSNYVVNLSSVDLSEAEIKLLSKGLSFCPTPRKVDWIELKADVEDFSRRLRLKEYFHGRESSQYISDPNPFKKKSTWTPNKDRDLGLELFIQLLKNDILNSKPSKIADNISKSEREALQTLINHTDIVIKPADKGKATVILNTDDYKKECYCQLNDSKFYRKLQKDTPTILKNELNAASKI